MSAAELALAALLEEADAATIDAARLRLLRNPDAADAARNLASYLASERPNWTVRP